MAESNQPTEYVIRGKGMFDECESLDEMIEALEAHAKDLRQMKEWGYELSESPVVDDYAFLTQRGA